MALPTNIEDLGNIQMTKNVTNTSEHMRIRYHMYLIPHEIFSGGWNVRDWEILFYDVLHAFSRDKSDDGIISNASRTNGGADVTTLRKAIKKYLSEVAKEGYVAVFDIDVLKNEILYESGNFNRVAQIPKDSESHIVSTIKQFA